MTQLAVPVAEIQPGMFPDQGLPFFNDDQSWLFKTDSPVRYAEVEAEAGVVISRVDRGTIATQEMELVYSGIVWDRAPSQELGAETGPRRGLANLATLLGDDSEALLALSTLTDKVALREQALRADRHLRMASIVEQLRGSLFVLTGTPVSTRQRPLYGSFAKLWGITVDETHRVEPVVVGKDAVPARLEPWQAEIGLNFLYKVRPS